MEARYILIRLSTQALHISPSEISGRYWDYHQTFEEALDATRTDNNAAIILGPDNQVLWRAPWVDQGP